MTEFSSAVGTSTRAIRALFPPTPLQRNEHLSQRYGCDLWLKREDLSPVRSYKIRGAFNAMRKVLARGDDRRHFVCASAGNHAQGVAFACRHFGVRGTIFMPVTTPQQKIARTRAFGGDQVETRRGGRLDQLGRGDIAREHRLRFAFGPALAVEQEARRRLWIEIPQQGSACRQCRGGPSEVDRKGGLTDAALEAVDRDRFHLSPHPRIIVHCSKLGKPRGSETG